MAVISETSDDGDDPNKKPKQQEEENQNKKLKGLAMTSLPIPDDLKIALVSDTFRRLITSPDLYAARSIKGNTEHVLYALIQFSIYKSPRWYILQRKHYKKTIQLRLAKIKSLPPMPSGSAVVTIGHEIYVIGGCFGESCISEVTLIDCRSRTCRSLPRMNVARYRPAAGVVDGKIYVIGGNEMSSSLWVEVFDVNKQSWIGYKLSIAPNMSGISREISEYAVIQDKIFFLDQRVGYVYEPKRDQFMFNYSLEITKLSGCWREPYCVIDDMLFCMTMNSRVGVCDPEENLGRPVKGLQGFPVDIDPRESRMANFDGKLVILGADKSRFRSKYMGKQEVWCVEIGLDRRGDEVWGNVESVAVVLTSSGFPSVEVCQTVIV